MKTLKLFTLLALTVIGWANSSAATTIYIDTNSKGNIWAWDENGNYFEEFPGNPISKLSKATINGTEFYTFTYDHESANEKLILSYGNQQTEDIIVADGKIYRYTGGTNYCTIKQVPIVIERYSSGYLYTWDVANDNETDKIEQFGSWPGKDISNLTLKGDYQVFLNLREPAENYSQGMKFSENGEKQTEDLAIVENQLYTYNVTLPEGILLSTENFPDEAFRNYLSSTYDKNGDSYLNANEIEKMKPTTGSYKGKYTLDVSQNQDIKSLEGIALITPLQVLVCSGKSTSEPMQIENLDLRGCANLEKLDCSTGILKQLNVDGLSKLTTIDCQWNILTELDITGCINLSNFDATHNEISHFDPSPAGSSLKSLTVDYNKLGTVDVSANPELTSLKCSHMDTFTSLDITKNAKLKTLKCNYTGISELDITQNPLIDSYYLDGCPNLKNTTLDFTNSTAVSFIRLTERANILLKGLNRKATLTKIDNVNNSRFEDDMLDLTGCNKLTKIHIYSCGLKQLILDGCENIEEMDIFSNYLRDLDLKDVKKTFGYKTNYNSAKIKHSTTPTQNHTDVKADVSLVYVDRDDNLNVKSYTYLVYLRLDDQKTSEVESSLKEGLLMVGPTDFNVARIKQWVRIEPGQGDKNGNIEPKVVVGSNDISVINGTRPARIAPTEPEADKIIGNILSLGMYTVPAGAGDQSVSGKIAYVYDTKNDEVTEKDETYNGDALDTISKTSAFYNNLADNLIPFEVAWYADLSDDPDKVVTSIDEIMPGTQVAEITYYNTLGMMSHKPFEGVNIVVTRYSNGTTTTTKVVK